MTPAWGWTLATLLVVAGAAGWMAGAYPQWRKRQERRANHEPPYGFGYGARPLWSEQDRRAEQVRAVLRAAGLPGADEHPAGFTVHTTDDRSRFVVTCHDHHNAVDILARYHEALHAGGFGARADPDDVHRILVHR